LLLSKTSVKVDEEPKGCSALQSDAATYCLLCDIPSGLGGTVWMDRFGIKGSYDRAPWLTQ